MMFLVKAVLHYPSDPKLAVCPDEFVPGKTDIENVVILCLEKAPQVSDIHAFETYTEAVPYSDQVKGLHLREWIAVQVFEYYSDNPGGVKGFYEVVFTQDGQVPVRNDWSKLPAPILCIPLDDNHPVEDETDERGYYHLVEIESYLDKLVQSWGPCQVQNFHLVGQRQAKGVDHVVICNCLTQRTAAA